MHDGLRRSTYYIVVAFDSCFRGNFVRSSHILRVWLCFCSDPIAHHRWHQPVAFAFRQHHHAPPLPSLAREHCSDRIAAMPAIRLRHGRRPPIDFLLRVVSWYCCWCCLPESVMRLTPSTSPILY
ncbi:hypothetical protein MPTK1_4g12770 [Marchantia polymorpha subsp. ruderalis]|uniref:Uncharacterized protein n=2 Tax=Marchantia polymorpha TaxID=3197 RepID=A0AAF6B9A4_MARPO|nr:hypothetical protein MARPO_0138s0014 [Marchantia polymorpha]BBN08588.1 hypothetical protein Mp_4g12770 [Marchantia polymorpha subsp. ruderalis]|eukprot:PTQ29574.1 hypothetical protein MARPO_0138s0014 [Marchantia polymorpha]